MYRLTCLLPRRELFAAQLPILIVALTIAEVYYKFQSFLLECMAFLATWYVLDLLVHVLLGGVIRGTGQVVQDRDSICQ